MEAYKELEQLFATLYRYNHLLALAGWDAQVKMPPKGAQARGAAMAELKKLCHDLLTNPRLPQLLAQAEAGAADALNELQRANLREMRRAYDNEAAVPDDFVQRKAKLITEAQQLWAGCRAANDFAAFLPTLQRMVDLSREEARLRSAYTGKGLYESLFAMYEPGLSLERLDAIFSDVRSWLPQLLRDTLERRKSIDATATAAPTAYPLDQQEALSRDLMRNMQYDFDAGRLDISAHPFTGMTKEDTRVTTNYAPGNYTKALFATVHETGHAKYEQNGGPRDMLEQPVCEARSLGVHESQSLLHEKTIGRSGAYAEFLAPYLIKHFGQHAAFTPDNLRKLHQHVEPSHIRIEADELCYPLHILLRYEIERALIEGTLEAADIPRVWNEKMKEYLGLETLGRDNIGCLQDVHWAIGYFGYFPTYALGAMLAAQLLAAIKKELGDDLVDKCIRTGDLAPIFAKQNEKIWSKGCLYETEELITKATGEPLNPRYFREHLERRYLRNED